MAEPRPIPNTNSIIQYLHCGQCIKDIKEKVIPLSPQQYAKTEVGFSELGIQIWCLRHNLNIAHIDFGGQKLRANTSALYSETAAAPKPN